MLEDQDKILTRYIELTQTDGTPIDFSCHLITSMRPVTFRLGDPACGMSKPLKERFMQTGRALFEKDKGSLPFASNNAGPRDREVGISFRYRGTYYEESIHIPVLEGTAITFAVPFRDHDTESHLDYWEANTVTVAQDRVEIKVAIAAGIESLHAIHAERISKIRAGYKRDALAALDRLIEKAETPKGRRSLVYRLGRKMNI